MLKVADHQRVRARFTRRECARSIPVHGLGPVIALARGHGGTAALPDHPPGATFMLSLPKTPR